MISTVVIHYAIIDRDEHSRTGRGPGCFRIRTSFIIGNLRTVKKF